MGTCYYLGQGEVGVTIPLWVKMVVEQQRSQGQSEDTKA